jgi:Lrp/AsnC family transcriptional regulator, leucine-responsive regulatory protein
MKSHLDEVDLQILALLQAEGRRTSAEIAKRVGLSPPPVLQRIRALEKSGHIRGYHALLDAEKMGFKLTALATVTLALHQEQPIEGFRKAVQKIPEVLECYNVSGEFDFLLKIVVRDMPAYEALVRERLSRIKGVAQIRTSFVLGVAKCSTQLPIE